MSVRLTRFASLLAVALAAVTLFAGGRVGLVDAPSRSIARRGPLEISKADLATAGWRFEIPQSVSDKLLAEGAEFPP
jgi:hypothetical protein